MTFLSNFVLYRSANGVLKRPARRLVCGNLVRWKYLPVILVSVCANAVALQNLDAQALVGGGRSSGMGNATTALRADAWGTSNPATLGSLAGRAISFFTSQSFGLAELQYSSFQFVEPQVVGALGLGISTFGFSDFRDTRISFTFARGFNFGSSRKIFFGLEAFYGQVAIGKYGSAGTAGVSFGAVVELSQLLDLGFSAQNLNGPRVGDQDELPRALSVGVQYRASDLVLVVADVRQEVDRPLSVRAGIEFQPASVLFLRTGVASQPTRFAGGVGVRVGLLSVDIAAQRHDVLGWTPAGGLSLLW